MDWNARNPQPGFDFHVADRPFSALQSGWRKRTTVATCDNGVRAETTFFADPQTGLEAEVERLRFPGFPAVEWVMRFRNTETQDSPLLSEMYPLDITFPSAVEPPILPYLDESTGTYRAMDFIVHYARGGLARAEDYAPETEWMGKQGSKTFALGTCGGKSSNHHMPFFNIQTGAREGVIGAIGWSGQWHVVFDVTDSGALRVRGGMETARLRLHPGEEIRTPRIVLFPWTGDQTDAHNAWRRFVGTHHTLPLRGKRPLPHIWANTWFTFDQGLGVTEANHTESLSAAGCLGIETLVVDAGWYECRKNWRDGAGSWVPRQETFPNGFVPVAERGKRVGVDFGIWFEPERAYAGSRLAREHPEWCLSLPSAPENPNSLVNLGLPEAQNWFVDLVDRYAAQGMRWFRHDFNIDPLPYWTAADARDRQGITEIRHVEGLYRVYDEIHRRHPDLYIEGCAGGGRRIDLETVSRNHGYWATDMICGTPEPMQAHIWGFNRYLPANLHNTVLQMKNAPKEDTPENRHWFFSFLGGAPCLCFDLRDPSVDVELGKKWLELFKRIRPYTLGDFYPLTEHGLRRDTWMAYQFDRPDLGGGVIAAFRRSESPHPLAEFRLRGLKARTRYRITNAFDERSETHSGAALMKVFRIMLDHRPDVAFFVYEKC